MLPDRSNTSITSTSFGGGGSVRKSSAMARMLAPPSHQLRLATICPSESKMEDPELPLSTSQLKYTQSGFEISTLLLQVTVAVGPARTLQFGSAGCRLTFLVAPRGWWMMNSGSPRGGGPGR